MAKKKFDLAIMNPPYDGSLHLKILEKVIPVADEVVNISPIRWLQDPLAKYKKNSDYNKFEESISKHIESIRKNIDSKELFDVECNTLGIIKVKEDSIKDVYKSEVKNQKLAIKIINKFDKTLRDVIVNDDFDGICILTSLMVYDSRHIELRMSKGLFSRDKKYLYYTDKKNDSTGETYLEYRTKTAWGNNKPKATNTNIKFNSTKERDNFFDSYRTTFLRWLYNYEIVDVNVHSQFLPWMGDVKNPRTGKVGYESDWTNQDFCKYFNITGFISDTEAEPGSEWEEILKTMEKYK